MKTVFQNLFPNDTMLRLPLNDAPCRAQVLSYLGLHLMYVLIAIKTIQEGAANRMPEDHRGVAPWYVVLIFSVNDGDPVPASAYLACTNVAGSASVGGPFVTDEGAKIVEHKRDLGKWPENWYGSSNTSS